MADQKMLTEKQKQLLSGITGQQRQVAEAPFTEIRYPIVSEEERAAQGLMPSSEEVYKQMLLRQAQEQQAQPRFQNLQQKLQPSPMPTPTMQQQGAIPLSDDPEEMQRQIEMIRQNR